MIAIKLLAAGLLMMGGTAELRSFQNQQGGPAPQQNPQMDAQEQPQATPENAADDLPEEADNPATGEAETDSMRSDMRAPSGDVAWLVGRWCAHREFLFELSAGGQLTMPEGTARDYFLHPVVANNRTVLDLVAHMPAPPGSDYGFHELGRFFVARGESSFRTVRGRELPIERC